MDTFELPRWSRLTIAACYYGNVFKCWRFDMLQRLPIPLDLILGVMMALLYKPLLHRQLNIVTIS